MKNRKKNYISRLSSTSKPFVKIENIELYHEEAITSTSTEKKRLLPSKNSTNLSSTSLSPTSVTELILEENTNMICVPNASNGK